MRSVILAIAVFAALTGCSPDPRSRIIPNDLERWDDLRPHIESLSSADKNLLAGYLARVKIAEAMGSSGMPEGMTVGAAIDNQRQFETAQAAEAAALTEASAKLKLSIGRARQEYGWYTLPVMLENQSDATFGYVEVTCRFLSSSGQLLATDMTNWSEIPARGTVSGDITSNAFKASEVTKTDCATAAQ